MKWTIGNNQPGPTSPGHASQLFASVHPNDGKCAAHGAVGDTEASVAWDIPFDHFYIIRQTNKGGGKNGVKHGFVDANGNYIGLVGHDQDAPCLLTKAQFNAHNGNVRWQAEFLKAGDYVFQGGAG